MRILERPKIKDLVKEFKYDRFCLKTDAVHGCCVTVWDNRVSRPIIRELKRRGYYCVAEEEGYIGGKMWYIKGQPIRDEQKPYKTYRVGDVLRLVENRRAWSGDIHIIVELPTRGDYYRVLSVRGDGHFIGCLTVCKKCLDKDYIYLGHFLYIDDIKNTARKAKDRFKKEL